MIRPVCLNLAVLCILVLSNQIVSQSQNKPTQQKLASKEQMETKTAIAFYQQLEGDWEGLYSLWLRPGTPAQESDISADFQSAVKGVYFLMIYSWKRGDKAYEGVFLFGGRRKAATATWGDSFHMAPEPMQCKGELIDGGSKLILNGSYAAGEGPEWGWRTEFTSHSPDSLLMEAYNITPDGIEALAVKAELKRVIKD